MNLVENGRVDAVAFAEGDGGTIDFDVDALVLLGDSQIRAETGESGQDSQNTGNAGAITLTTDLFRLEERSEVSAASFSRGDAGAIDIESGSVTLLSGGAVESIVTGAGSGSTIDIRADQFVAQGAFIPDDPDDVSRAQPSSVSSTAGPFAGDAGSITVEADVVQLLDSGRIGAETFGDGRGGDVTVTANDRLVIRGVDTELEEILRDSESFEPPDFGGLGSISLNITRDEEFAQSAIAASTLALLEDGSPFSADGDGGTITVTAGDVEIADGGLIASDTATAGDGGSIRVTATSVSIEGAGDGERDTGIFARSREVTLRSFDGSETEVTATGDAGDVTVTANSLSMTGESEIRTSTDGEGNGGTIRIEADSISLTDDAEVLASTEGEGRGGLVDVRADFLRLAGDAEIASDTEGEGDADRVVVTARTIEVLESSEISSDTGAEGNGGDVFLDASESVFIQDEAGVFTNAKVDDE